MKEERKKEIKQNILNSVSTTSGAVVGAMIENAFNPTFAEAEDLSEPEILSVSTEEIEDVQDFDSEHEQIKPESVHNGHIENQISTSHSIPQSQMTGSENQIPDDEITVVSINPENQDHNDFIEEVEVTATDNMDSTEPPIEADELPTSDIIDSDIIDSDQSETKANNLVLEGSGMTKVDMPDYVNNANIDSFTQEV